MELDAQIDAAVRENAAIRTTADFREGITSFLEKRKPVWTRRNELATITMQSKKPACACATPKPIRWASSITPTT